MNVKLDKAAVIIESHKQALLTQPDPTLKGGFRVPSDMSGSAYTAADWQNCWAMGKFEFIDSYFLSHQGRTPSEDDLKKCADYLYVNLLDPAFVDNWKIAWTRLMAADVIKSEAPKTVPVKESQEPKFIDIDKIDDRTPEGRRKLKAAMWSNLMLESQPVIDQFFADLNAAGHYPTYEERRAMAEYVENHNLFPHQVRSWDRALRTLFPKYLDDEGRALIALDRDDGPGTYVTAAEIKKAVGTASLRVGFAVPSR